MGAWSMAMTLSMPSAPVRASWGTGIEACSVEAPREGPVESLFNQGRLARARHPGDGGEHSEGNFDREVSEVVGPGSGELDFATRRSALCWRGRAKLSTEESTREGPVEGRRWTLKQDAAAVGSGPFAKLEDPVCGPDHARFVFDENECVARRHGLPRVSREGDGGPAGEGRPLARRGRRPRLACVRRVASRDGGDAPRPRKA